MSPILRCTALLASALLSVAANAAEKPADLIVINGKVYTADKDRHVAEAVAVRGNRIVRVGTNADVSRLRARKTQVVDAHGHSVLPGFIDNHVHFLAGVEASDGPQFAGAHTVKEAQDAITAFLDRKPDVEWIVGGGAYVILTKDDLDAVTRGKPAVLLAGDGHSVVANSKAMQIAGIDRNTPAPTGGEIVKDPVSGEPNGIFMETAQEVIARAVPAKTTHDVEEMLGVGTLMAHKAGVTTILNVARPAELEAYQHARAEGKLHLRIHNALWLTPVVDDGLRGLGFPSVFTFTGKDADDFDALRRKYQADDLMTVDMVKIMLDGVIESHTASMLGPYANDPGVGVANYSPAELTRLISLMDGRGWKVMTHALGDRAVRITLDAYEAAERNNAAFPGRRFKIEHIESIDPSDVDRFGKLNVVASLQPGHAKALNDPQRRGGLRWKNLGFERSAWGFPWKSIKDSGGVLAFGSDWPVADLNAGTAISIALNRHVYPPIPDQSLPMADIIDAYTRNGAYAIGAENSLGSLEVGKLADIIVLSNDIFQNFRPENFVVDHTIFDGKIAYTRQ